MTVPTIATITATTTSKVVAQLARRAVHGENLDEQREATILLLVFLLLLESVQSVEVLLFVSRH